MTNNVFNWNIQGIEAFFRVLSTHTLKEDVVEQLHENILILLCNLKKIFPLAFFDVKEHLAATSRMRHCFVDQYIMDGFISTSGP